MVLVALVSCNTKTAGSPGSRTDMPADSIVGEDPNIPAFLADSAYSYVAGQVAFGPRNPGSQSHSRCATFLTDKLRGFGADTVMTHTPIIDVPYAGKIRITNILARFNTAMPRRILLLAHWDTRPIAEEDPDPALRDKPIPGANDGASGAGVLLEVARILGSCAKPEVGVDILLVDAEDSGNHNDDTSWCLGTQEWLRTYPSGLPGPYSPSFAVLLDMVGAKDARFPREMFSDSFAPQIVNDVWSAAVAAGHSLTFPNARGGAITDDHVLFNKSGIPAIDIIESKNPVTGGFNPTWHTHADDMDNISVKTLEAVGETVIRLLYTQK